MFNKTGKLSDTVKKCLLTANDRMPMPDRLFIATSGTADAFVLSIQTRDKLGRTLSYFDCPPMRIGDTIDVGGLRDALLKFSLV